MTSVAKHPLRTLVAGAIALTAIATGAHLAGVQAQTPTPEPTIAATVGAGTPTAQTPVAQTPVAGTPTTQPIATQPAVTQTLATPTAAVQTPAASAPTVQATIGPQIVVVTSTPVPVPRALNVAGVNLLTNPGHEHPGTNFAGRSDVNLTWNWNPFWEDPPAGADKNDSNYRTPEFRASFARDNPTRVRSGAGSDRWRNTLSVNKKAGIMQYVADLPVGAPIRFSSWLQEFSTDDDTIAAEKSTGGDLKVRVCIDQDGGPRDLTDPNLVCSDWKQPFDTWEQLSVDGIAKNSVVNAIVWSMADTPILFNDVYADESCFEILPAAAAKGVCAGAGLIETGPNVQPLPANVGSIKITAEEQARLGKALAGTPVAASAPAASALAAPNVITPSLTVNARVFMNVREEPSQTAGVATTAQRGTVLPVLAKSQDGKWFQVDLDGTTGWVLGSLTLPNAAAIEVPIAP